MQVAVLDDSARGGVAYAPAIEVVPETNERPEDATDTVLCMEERPVPSVSETPQQVQVSTTAEHPPPVRLRMRTGRHSVGVHVLRAASGLAWRDRTRASCEDGLGVRGGRRPGWILR